MRKERKLAGRKAEVFVWESGILHALRHFVVQAGSIKRSSSEKDQTWYKKYTIYGLKPPQLPPEVPSATTWGKEFLNDLENLYLRIPFDDDCLMSLGYTIEPPVSLSWRFSILAFQKTKRRKIRGDATLNPLSLMFSGIERDVPMSKKFLWRHCWLLSARRAHGGPLSEVVKQVL